MVNVLTEAAIRYAMRNCNSAQQCANFLNVSFNTFKKYSTMYVDFETGKTLFEIAKNTTTKKRPKKTRLGTEGSIDRILSGETKNFHSNQQLLERLLHFGKISEECSVCGYAEKRIIDYKCPLILDFINNDFSDGRLQNIKVYCYNCYFQNVGSLYFKKTAITTYDNNEYDLNEIDLSNIDTSNLDLSDL